MEYRNAIVNKYREDPTKVISIADIMQGNLGGNVVVVDEKSIARVLGFLDHWGLINYQAPEDWLPTWPNKEAADSLLEVDESGVSQALLPQTDTSLYKSHKARSPASSKQNATSKQSIMKQTAADRALAEALEKLQGPEVEYHCNSCAADCSRQRYHCQKQVCSWIPLCTMASNFLQLIAIMVTAEFGQTYQGCVCSFFLCRQILISVPTATMLGSLGQI
jgi:SWI/SNF related-matrix-associated actin-dependent regulator of chromatin subfamily C